MKIMTQVKRFGAKPAVFGAAVMTASGFALADSAEAVAAIKGSLTDVNTIGWTVVGVLAGIMVFRLIKRVL
ncbi:MAG: hypothetical protein KA006_00670 [Neisseria sp.]|nr:hypothetical protein [Neisseria sp.]